ITAWRNELQDRTVSPGSQYLVDNESDYPDRVIRDPATGFITSIDERLINVSRTEIAGVDLGLSSYWQTRIGEISASLGATYTYKYKEQVLPTSPVESHLAILNMTGWAPRWKIVPQVNF